MDCRKKNEKRDLEAYNGKTRFSNIICIIAPGLMLLQALICQHVGGWVSLGLSLNNVKNFNPLPIPNLEDVSFIFVLHALKDFFFFIVNFESGKTCFLPVRSLVFLFPNSSSIRTALILVCGV